MKALAIFLLTVALMHLEAPGLTALSPGPSALSYANLAPDTVLVIRVVEAGPEALESTVVGERYAEAQVVLATQPGYVASTLYEEAYPGSPFPFVTLTSWESASQMAAAAPALSGLWDPGVRLGQYAIERVRRSKVRPGVDSYAIMVPFASGVDREQVMDQIEYFDEAAAQAEGWLGSVTFVAAGGGPAYDLITLSSWATLDAARQFLGSGPIVNALIRISQEDLIPPTGISILRMASH